MENELNACLKSAEVVRRVRIRLGKKETFVQGPTNVQPQGWSLPDRTSWQIMSEGTAGSQPVQQAHGTRICGPANGLN